jgi:recombination protein RecR
MQFPEALERLIQEFSRLPGIGKKTATRLAFGVLRYSTEEAQNFAEAIQQVKEQIRHCKVCFAFTDAEVCSICADERRDHQLICVVEQPNNVFQIERSRVYQGVYHVLLGALSPLDGVGPDQLKIQSLRQRIQKYGVAELILATNPTVSGEATAGFLQSEFAETVPRITRLARGLPAGGDLEYVDEVTLQEAFSGRRGWYE